MSKECWAGLYDGDDIKEGLKAVKEGLGRAKKRGEAELTSLAGHLREEKDYYLGLLRDEDPKNRKNAAFICGSMGDGSVIPDLLEALGREETRYVRTSFLEAIAKLDYKPYAAELEKLYEELSGLPLTDENRKHILEEKKLLIGLTGKAAGSHRFSGYDLATELLLTTNRNHKHITLEAMGGLPKKEFNAGIMVKTSKVKEVLKSRLYDEAFFILDRIKVVADDPVEAGEQLISNGLLDYIDCRHDGEAPYRFRVTVKAKEERDIGRFSRALSGSLEEKSDWKLINSPDDYEVELRLVERTAGGYSVMLKLHRAPDSRFDYRREVVAASIRPYNAALTMALAGNYLAEDAVVLDPFCGVGTMLVERAMRKVPKAMYGIDIFGEAIAKAKKNYSSFKSAPKLYLVNRDFFEFRAEHPVDEIVTDMPFAMGKTGNAAIEDIYRRFFLKADEVLNGQGKIIMYSHDQALVKKYTRGGAFTIIEAFEISMREGTYVFILGRRNGE